MNTPDTRPTRAWLLAAALFVAAAATTITARAATALFDARSFTLDNGIEVILVPDHRVPVVTHMVWYRVGSADEPAGKSGIAHLLEHLMFKGTRDNPGDTLSREVQRLGGELNAFTSYDYTAYFETVPAQSLETVMALEADRMTNLVLDDDDVRTERDVVVEERRQRTDNNPEARLAEQVNAALYLNHRYGVPVIGWIDEIRSLTRADALAFYHRWYAPSNAIVVVAGDVTPERLKTLAERYYGRIRAPAVAPRHRPTEPAQVAERRVTVRDQAVRRGLWVRDYLAPSAVAGDTTLAPALEVLAEALGNESFGVLARELVRRRELAASIHVQYNAQAVDLTSFTITAVPRPGVSLETLETALGEVLDEIRARGIDTGTLDNARRSLTAGLVRARDGTQRAAQAIGAALAVGMPLQTVEHWPERIAAVDMPAMKRAVHALLQAQRSVTGVLVSDAAPTNGSSSNAATGGAS